MPVTIRPSPETVGRNCDPTKKLPELDKIWYLEALHSSFKNNRLAAGEDATDLCVYIDKKKREFRNGFVIGIIRAYQQDLHLILRPDDIWLAIISQFSRYVNKHAEEMRSIFVNHKGKQELELSQKETCAYTPQSLDVERLARMLTAQMEEYLVDKSIRDIIIPDFTTTTDEDVTMASMVLMATMQKYFDYSGCTGCGFPSVTLLGERSDWEDILRRARKLAEYSDDLKTWGALLKPVLTRFVQTFDNPESEDLKEFWLKTCHAETNGSGQSPTYSGWITAFRYWNDEGNLVHKETGRSANSQTPLELDGVTYPIILQKLVGSGIIEVPVIIKDKIKRECLEANVRGGCVGMRVSKGETDQDGDTLQPQNGWWMLVHKRRAMTKEDLVVKIAAAL